MLIPLASLSDLFVHLLLNSAVSLSLYAQLDHLSLSAQLGHPSIMAQKPGDDNDLRVSIVFPLFIFLISPIPSGAFIGT